MSWVNAACRPTTGSTDPFRWVPMLNVLSGVDMLCRFFVVVTVTYRTRDLSEVFGLEESLVSAGLASDHGH